MKALNDDTKEKFANVYSKEIIYGELKKNLPKKLIMSSVDMIPHKSRSYRTILQLSFHIGHRGTLIQLENSATVKHAPSESMMQLG